MGEKSKGIVLGTTVDLPLLAIRQTEKENIPKVADNNFVRRLLRQAMAEVGFTGHVKEAEHIMRAFKSRGRKPSETEDHYDLFRAYKQRLEQTGLCDRHDLVRKHIIGMRNDTYEALAVKHVFIDNFQDVTQIQLLWLVDHLKAGAKVYVQDEVCGHEWTRRIHLPTHCAPTPHTRPQCHSALLLHGD